VDAKTSGTIQPKKKLAATQSPRLVKDQLSRIPTFGPQVPRVSSLVVLLSVTYTLTYEPGGVVKKAIVNEVLLGFQMAGMPSGVLTAGHCIESVFRRQGNLVRREASDIYALSYSAWQKLPQTQWFDIAVLEEVGAQKVLSWRSEFPNSALQLAVCLVTGMRLLFEDQDAAILRLSGPLTGVGALDHDLPSGRPIPEHWLAPGSGGCGKGDSQQSPCRSLLLLREPGVSGPSYSSQRAQILSAFLSNHARVLWWPPVRTKKGHHEPNPDRYPGTVHTAIPPSSGGP
jgi:hypothetical protein